MIQVYSCQKYVTLISAEFKNIFKWSNENKLKVNISKTKELVFHRPNERSYLAPEELPDTEHVLCAKLLGVWLQNYLGLRKHVDYVMHTCNQPTYFLTQLKWHCLPLTQLQCVFDAIILSRFVCSNCLETLSQSNRNRMFTAAVCARLAMEYCLKCLWQMWSNKFYIIFKQ